MSPLLYDGKSKSKLQPTGVPCGLLVLHSDSLEPLIAGCGMRDRGGQGLKTCREVNEIRPNLRYMAVPLIGTA